MMSWDGFVSDKLKNRSYKNRSEAKQDILNAVKCYTDLTPKEDTYVTEGGKSSVLLNLYGTIPVNYKGSVYNIPIQIWLQPSHPQHAPIVYVRPTSSMVIRPNQHVDENGRVYLPLLSDWSTKPNNKFNLTLLIQHLCSIFGTMPPVYAKTGPQIPRPGRPYATPYPGSTPSYAVPHGGMPMPQPSGYLQQGSHHSTYSHQNNPPYPSQPHAAQYPSVSTVSPASYSSASEVPPYSADSSLPPYSATSSYQQSQPPAPTRQGSVIDPKTVRLSLVSTVEDKLRQRIREVFEMGRIEQESLQITKEELEMGNKTLKDMLGKMREEEAVLTTNISQLEQKNEELEDTLRKLDSESESMNIDEAVVTTAPIYTQILNLFAEESAIEDALYYLSEGLRREVVELEVFLKNVRTMSRKQFMLRATLLKSREAACLR